MKSTLRIAFAIYFLCFMACKKNSAERKEETKVPAEQPAKKFVPVKFESDKLQISLKYQENTANLIEIAGSDGYVTLITYKNQQPYEIKKMKQNQPFQLVDYVKDKEGLPKARCFDESGPVFTPTGFYILNYDLADQLTKIRYYKDNAELFRESVLSYSLGNVTELVQSDYPGGSKKLHCTYDLKNGIFKHVKYWDRLFLETRYPFFNPGQNNILSSADSKTPLENVTYSYEYNADDLPVKLSVTERNITQSFTITYIELKP
jgi:hypothetical protein